MDARPPIVLIHGACSRPGHFDVWREMFMRAGYECHAPALPGHDPSRRDVLRQACFRDYVSDLIDIVLALGGPAVLVGHSLGALIARMVAAEADVKALLLLAPSPLAACR